MNKSPMDFRHEMADSLKFFIEASVDDLTVNQLHRIQIVVDDWFTGFPATIIFNERDEKFFGVRAIDAWSAG